MQNYNIPIRINIITVGIFSKTFTNLSCGTNNNDRLLKTNKGDVRLFFSNTTNKKSSANTVVVCIVDLNGEIENLNIIKTIPNEFKCLVVGQGQPYSTTNPHDKMYKGTRIESREVGKFATRLGCHYMRADIYNSTDKILINMVGLCLGRDTEIIYETVFDFLDSKSESD
jgi:hypothetical protein